MIINNREYTDKENIDYILSELDDRFSTARSKIETRINDLYVDPLHPHPFPPQFQAGPKLSINIMNLIPHAERNGVDYTNHGPSINKVNTRSWKQDTERRMDSSLYKQGYNKVRH